MLLCKEQLAPDNRANEATGPDVGTRMPEGKLVIRFGIECNIHSLNSFNVTKNNVSDNPEKTTRNIPARSRRDAMDLALALASQDIHATIAKTDEGWRLEVEEFEYEGSLKTIELYRKENRHWRGWNWHQHFPYSGLWFHWGSVFWCATILTLYYWNKVRFPQLEEFGIMDNTAIGNGQWWRLFTAITLHADVSHLAANVSTGFLLVGIAMASYGPGFGLSAAYLAGAGGNLLGLFIYPVTHKSLGASGMVMGALGLAGVQTIVHWQEHSPIGNRRILRSLAAACAILILLGFSPNSDVIAHVGGFIFGCLLGVMLQRFPKWLRQNTTVNQVCVLLLLAWVVFTWKLAVR